MKTEPANICMFCGNECCTLIVLLEDGHAGKDYMYPEIIECTDFIDYRDFNNG